MVGAEHDSLTVRAEPLEEQAPFGVVLLEDVAAVISSYTLSWRSTIRQASSKRGKSEGANTTGSVGKRRAISSIVSGGRLDGARRTE